MKYCQDCGLEIKDRTYFVSKVIKDNFKFCNMLCRTSNERRKNLLKLENLEVLTLAVNGYTFSDIAKIFSLSRERIRQKVKMYDLTAKDWNIRQDRTVKRKVTKCLVCGSDIVCESYLKRFCSDKCTSEYMYKNTNRDDSERFSPSSRRRPAKKYKMIYIGCVKGKSKYKQEHRVVMEKHLGRELNSNEQVHHINGNGLNNDINNLIIVSRDDHLKITTKMEYKNYQSPSPIVSGYRIFTNKEKRLLTNKSSA